MKSESFIKSCEKHPVKFLPDELIQFDTAKFAKEKGFDIRCDNFFNEGSGFQSQSDALLRLGKDEIIERPTQTCLARWLREDFNLQTFVDCVNFNQDAVYFSERNTFKSFVNYEEAFEIELQEALSEISCKE